MKRCCLTCFLIAFCLVSVSAGAAGPGQDKQDPKKNPQKSQAEDKAKAKKWFRAGTKYYKKGELDKAIESFKKAYSFWKRRSLLLNIAVCYSEKDEPVEAVTYLSRALKGADQKERQEIRGAIPAKLKEAEENVGVLKISVFSSRATIIINDEPVGVGSVEQVVKAGTHEIVIREDGVELERRSVKVSGGKIEKVIINRYTEVKDTKETDMKEEDGDRSAVAKWWGNRRRFPLYYFASAAALTLVSGVTAIATGVKAKNYHDDFYDNPTHSTRDKGIMFRNTANAFIGITVVAGVATAALGVFTEWKMPFVGKKEVVAPVSVAPHVGPSGGGLTFSGSF